MADPFNDWFRKYASPMEWGNRDFVRAAFEAGRKAGLEEAADWLTVWGKAFQDEQVKSIAAALRARAAAHPDTRSETDD